MSEIIDTFGYKIVLLFHVLAVIVAFAPSFVWPFVAVKLRKAGEPVGPTINRLVGGNTAKIYGPAAVVAGLLGAALVGMSKPEQGTEALISFSDTWVTLAFVAWFAILGVMFGLIAPNEDKAANGDERAASLISMSSGIIHGLLALQLFLMVFKPGFTPGG